MIPGEYIGWMMLLVDPAGKKVVQYQVKGNDQHGRIQVLMPHPEDERPDGTIWTDDDLCDLLGAACKEVDRHYLLASYVRRKVDGSLSLMRIRVWKVGGPEVEKDLAKFVKKRAGAK